MPTVQITNTQIEVQNLLPQQIVDCAATNLCCSDTVLYNSAVFCNSNGSYILPDETVVHQSGVYYSNLKTAKGCDSVIFTSLTQASAPKIFLGDDTCLPNNTPLTIRIPHDSLTHFLWQDGSTTSSYTITDPGIYWAKATSVCGTTTDSIQVYPHCSLPISVPNAFTPNGDGRNDVFKIADMRHQQLIDFSIYNRYGQKVFETKDPLKGWDGKLQGQNLLLTTFVYIIYYKDLKSQLHFLKGTATLIK